MELRMILSSWCNQFLHMRRNDTIETVVTHRVWRSTFAFSSERVMCSMPSNFILYVGSLTSCNACENNDNMVEFSTYRDTPGTFINISSQKFQISKIGKQFPDPV
ncbi:hypothetical protein OCU04_002799 [Sclerotinia nivalis]|uniref:Uncharacterized protein n=1 Tax=Sclerotinia nivalis TaxID=352851 RepID=A0A9X0AUH6_9HELO|nr:hypothetical protein OCU04_002799 [Sclerotinia nivalis]